MLKDMLNTRDVAYLLGVSTQTVRALAESGQLPFTRHESSPKSRYFFQKAAVQAFMAEHGNGLARRRKRNADTWPYSIFADNEDG